MASTAIATSLSPVIMMASCGAPPAVAAAESVRSCWEDTC
jgi:hypothetical protein